MIKVTAEGPAGKLVMLGLSHRNLEQLKAGYPIPIDGKQLGLDADLLIFSEETEQIMHEKLEQFIGPQTKVTIDPKLKS